MQLLHKEHFEVRNAAWEANDKYLQGSKSRFVRQISQDSSRCGRPILQPTALILGGAETNKGDWPWLVAFYNTPERGTLKYICGGSLISHRHVVTAAHCIQSKNERDSDMRKPENALFLIGKYSIEDWQELGYIRTKASKFIVHPDWSTVSQSYDADIALVELSVDVQYTTFIQPLCLWSEISSELKAIVGQNGVIVGWVREFHYSFK